SGEVATGIQTAAIESMGSFLGVMLDPSIAGRGGVGDSQMEDPPEMRGALDLPDDRSMKVWTNFHGLQSWLHGDALLGTHAAATSEIGGEMGFDYIPAAGNGAIGIVLGAEDERWKLT